MVSLGRRGFVVGGGLVLACDRSLPTEAARAREAPSILDASPSPATPATPASTDALFDAFPALGRSLQPLALGRYPSPVEAAPALLGAPFVHVKRDDDFTRSASFAPSFEPAKIFGGGKIRKLELLFGEARAMGKRRIVTAGGVGSNQALAVALLGSHLGFEVRIDLAPQPRSSLTAKNLAADAASRAEMRLCSSVSEAHARELREAETNRDVYVIPPGGTTPLGTLGFVGAGLELARDVRAGRLPPPRRIYVALGLGGTAAGLGLGCALAGLETEIVAVRTSNPTTVTPATLRRIHERTVAFARARDASFGAISFAGSNVRIDGRFVGAGYGVPTRAGDEALALARRSVGWELDPVYTGKALAALVADVRAGFADPVLFWNTATSRPLPRAPVPPELARHAG